MRTGIALASLCIVLGLIGCRASEEEASSAVTEEPDAWFADITTEVAVDFRHDSGWNGSYFMPEHIGAGCALFDYDGDGDLDLYLIDSGPHTDQRVGGRSVINRFFEQQATGSYVEQTERSGLGDAGYGMGSAVGDYDNDGDLDVFVTNLGPDALYRNEGDGTSSNVTSAAGLLADLWSVSTCFFDYDRDGKLDLYVATYVHHDEAKVCSDEAGRPES